MIQTDELKNVLTHYKKAFSSIAIFSAIINILMLVPSIYMLQVYDRVMTSGDTFTLLMLSAISLGLLVLMGAMDFVRSIIAIHVGEHFNQILGPRIYESSFKLGLRAGNANATQAFNDLNTLRQFLTGGAIFAFCDAPWFPIYLLILYLFSPWLGAVATIGSLLLIFLAWLNEKLSHQKIETASQFSLNANRMAEGHLRNAEAIESMGMMSRLFTRWQRIQRVYVDLQGQASQRTSIITACSKTVRIALQSGLLGIGALLALNGSISAGMMIAGSILGGRVLAPIDSAINAWRQWANVRVSRDRLTRLLNAYPSEPSMTQLPPPKGDIRFEKVTIVPPGATHPSLYNINVSMPAGTVLGVVGSSGSGKSSLARAAVGVWSSAQGTVRIDGADIAHWKRDYLGQFIGYLPQDVELFEGTIAENISRFNDSDGSPDTSTPHIIEAAKLAGAHELILSFPEGYDTRLGIAGMGLSGGQRQRIGLARAVFGQPALVVLDEPNASLDEAGDKALARAIQRLRDRKTTVIVISHRPNILAVTHKVLTLKEGHIQSLQNTIELFGKSFGKESSSSPSNQKMPPHHSIKNQMNT